MHLKQKLNTVKPEEGTDIFWHDATFTTELGVTGWFHLKETSGTIYIQGEKLKSEYNGKVRDENEQKKKKPSSVPLVFLKDKTEEFKR